jgi:hypothetical protein
MSPPRLEGQTPSERLLISRERIRNAFVNAPHGQDSVLQAVLASTAAKHPLGLAAAAALLGACLMAAKPWRWPFLKAPLMVWASAAVSQWLQKGAPPN